MAELFDSDNNTPDLPAPESAEPADGGAELDELDGDGETRDATGPEAFQDYLDQIESGLDRTDAEGTGLPAGDAPETGPAEPADAAEADEGANAAEADEGADAADADEGADVQEADEGRDVQEADEQGGPPDEPAEDTGEAAARTPELQGMTTGEALRGAAVEATATAAGSALKLSRFYENLVQPAMETVKALGGPRGAIAALRAWRPFHGKGGES